MAEEALKKAQEENAFVYFMRCIAIGVAMQKRPEYKANKVREGGVGGGKGEEGGKKEEGGEEQRRGDRIVIA